MEGGTDSLILRVATTGVTITASRKMELTLKQERGRCQGTTISGSRKSSALNRWSPGGGKPTRQLGDVVPMVDLLGIKQVGDLGALTVQAKSHTKHVEASDHR
jgi:hypothetical protein